MTNSKTVEVTGTIVDLLTPLESEQRLRVVQAVLALLGEKAGTLDKSLNDERRDGSTPEMESLPPRAKIWVKQNEIGFEELEQVFHLASGGAEVILVPGNNRKEQTLNAYIL